MIMNRTRPKTIDNRLQEIIDQLEPAASQNRLKLIEPPPLSITYPVQQQEKR
jgi:hypothetical protein